jgi:hypothetical protein
MLYLEVVSPGGSLSVAFSWDIMVKRQLETAMADTSGDSSRRLQQGGGDGA